MCDLCTYSSNLIYSNSLKVCKTCYSAKPPNLITKTDAKKKFPINDNDMDGVRHITYKNIYTTNLFLIKDIKFIATKKFGSEEAYKKKQNEKRKNKERRENEIITKKEYNKEYLNKYLKSIGLSGIRNDSTLCQLYIDHGERSGYTVEEIGKIMSEMNFFYTKTNYHTILKNLRQSHFDDARNYGYYLRWTQEDEENIRNTAKHIALKDYITKNKNNIHKIILEIPPSLKNDADTIYEKIRPQLIKKVCKFGFDMDPINRKVREVNYKIDQTMQAYKDLMKSGPQIHK